MKMMHCSKYSVIDVLCNLFSRHTLIIIHCIVICFFTTQLTAQKWIWRNPLPHGIELIDVITKGDTIFASTASNIFSFSSDAGATWELRTHDSIQVGSKMLLLDGNKILMPDRNGFIAVTTDWGKNWDHTQYGSMVANAPIAKFFDLQNGMLILLNPTGAYIVWRTTDGGANWSEEIYHQYHAHSISFISDNESYLAGQNQDSITGAWKSMLLFSDDQLHTWKGINTLPAGCTAIYSVLFESKQNGLIATDNGIYRTTDSGVTWTAVTTMQYNSQYVQFALDRVTGFYYLMHGYNDYSVSRSSDGGASWIPVFYNVSALMKNIYVAPHSKLYVYGECGVMYYSSDNGIVWNKVHGIGPTSSLNSIHFADSQRSVAISLYGSSYLTSTNGGLSWNENILSSGMKFLGNDFFSADGGYALTQQTKTGLYFLLSTSDGGFTWNSISQIPVKKYVVTGLARPIVIAAVEQGKVWVGAQFGTLYNTVDNGQTWNVHYVFPDYFFYNGDQSIFALDDAHVWFTQAHILSVSNDSMKNFFIADPTSLKYPAYAMYPYFLNTQDGFMTGIWTAGNNPLAPALEFLLRSSNAGENWEIVQGIGGRRMSFVNDKLALLYGQSTDYYPIYITEDGWNSWVSYRSQYNSMMSGMLLVDKNTCWGVGANGMIMEFKR